MKAVKLDSPVAGLVVQPGVPIRANKSRRAAMPRFTPQIWNVSRRGRKAARLVILLVR
jgi:hypothetical protein